MVNDHLIDWNIGILEDWNDGYKQVKKEVWLIPQYSIIPKFHYSIFKIGYRLFPEESFRFDHQYNRHHHKDDEELKDGEEHNPERSQDANNQSPDKGPF